MTKELAGTASSRATFYPTPRHLANKMLDGIEMKFIENVLEPSAGKGDLADAVAERLRYSNYSSKERKRDIDCIEIDPDLQAILKGKEYRVIHDDFLTFRTYKKYDLIVMNPPFDAGAAHLLKAVSLLEKSGGIVVCLLNAETIRNPYSMVRQELLQTIARYSGTVTECGKAFTDAERKTDVDVVIVRIEIKAPEHRGSILDEMRKAVDDARADDKETEYTALVKGNFIEALVDRCEYEMACGVRLIDEFHAFNAMVSSMSQKKNKYETNEAALSLTFSKGDGGATHNEFIRKVRRKYWSLLFQQPDFLAQLTSNLRDELHSMVNDLADYDFSCYNIYTLAQQMLKQINTGIEETILNLFDDWTRKYHWDENSQNRHYYNGWRTNDAFAVEKKVIFPFYGAFGSWYSRGNNLDVYECKKKIFDIEKVFDYLDGCVTDGTDCKTAIENADAAGITRNIQCKHFKVTFYKKGTCHVQFTNLDVLHKFNLFAAMNKHWLPPSYGKKRYTDMDSEEQAVIDSFEGKESYERVMQRSDYFLNTTPPPLLNAGA